MVRKIFSDIWDNIDFSSEKGSSLQEIISAHMKRLIMSGLLKSGDKLPSQRELAQHIGVSLQTISRVINGLVEDGYIYTISRKGMFINQKFIKKNIHTPLIENDNTVVNLSTNSPAIVIDCFDEYIKLKNFSLFNEKIENHNLNHINKFFSSYFSNDFDNQIWMLTYGSYQAIFISLLFLKIKYKDLIVLCEKITFIPIIKICKSLKIQLHCIENTFFSCGKATESICSIINNTNGKKYILYMINPLHNPLLYTHTKSELSIIADCAIRNNMFIIEDGSYFFSSDNYTSFHDFAPYHTFTILSTSKFLPSMLRLGILYAPRDMNTKLLKSIHESISWSEPLLETKIFLKFINSNFIIKYLKKYMEEIYKRNEKAKEILGDYIYKSVYNGCHILVKNIYGLDIMEKSNGKILVSTGDSFSSDNENDVLFDRVSLISVRDKYQLYDALLEIRTILESQ